MAKKTNIPIGTKKKPCTTCKAVGYTLKGKGKDQVRTECPDCKGEGWK